MIRKRVILPMLIFTSTFLLLSRFKLISPKITPRTINILYWTPMFNSLDFNLGLGGDIFKDCEYSNCFTTWNRSHLPVEEFDAILFHAVDYTERMFGRPKKRSPHQIYIFSNQESPVHTPSFIRDSKNFYNWTMTYRLDSDILRPYGFINKTTTAYQIPDVKQIKSRPNLIAWMSSNCGTQSKREQLHAKLSKFLPIDVYGICGNTSCPKSKGDECYSIIEYNYKFYLSFENSLCQDYVTEKLYNLLKRNIVPIVYGGADYKKIVPPHSVINVDDFRDLETLAKYILQLDANVEDYVGYFEWKKNYVVDTSNQLALCSMCEKLNEPRRVKVYSDMELWWKGAELDKCSNAKDFE